MTGHSTVLAATPLRDWHAAHGARLVDFAGWEMPVQYTSIVEEHKATRAAATLFDVSHMGRIRFDGPDAARLLDRLVTRRVVGLAPGKVRYALVCNEAGGILDDVLVYHLVDADGADFHSLVVNASNREKILAWLAQHAGSPEEAHYRDQTRETAMIAVQGPRAIEVVREALGIDVEPMGYYTATVTRVLGAAGVVSRTGYTGEDGCEIVVPADRAAETWQKLFDVGQACGLLPAGLGARDTLRLEAGMPLYGHELSETINPYQAGLGFAVDLRNREFLGREALQSASQDKLQRVRVGLEAASRRVPREHSPLIRSSEDPTPVGEVTSGTFSPTLERPIAMAYVDPEYAAPGTRLTVDIRGKSEPAQVVKLPFYKRA